MMPQKTYILDTNIPLYEPETILKIKDSDIYTPITVIEEIDGLKKDTEKSLTLTGRRKDVKDARSHHFMCKKAAELL
jgi:PhoH-like ATPase